MVDIYVYTYEDSNWELQSKSSNQPNSGHASVRMGRLEKRVQATCIHVTVGQVNDASLEDDRELVESLHSITLPFPSRVGIWSGLLFSVHNDRTANDKRAEEIRRGLFSRQCSQWCNRKKEKIPNDVIKSLPPCPPTLDRAQLPNSGLEEENFESSLYTTSYHNQWMSTFHPEASVCYVQATVRRLAFVTNSTVSQSKANTHYLCVYIQWQSWTAVLL